MYVIGSDLLVIVRFFTKTVQPEKRSEPLFIGFLLQFYETAVCMDDEYSE